MHCHSILRPSAYVALTSVLALSASMARADVLEINNGEVQWIAGGPVEHHQTLIPNSARTNLTALPNGAAIPARYAAFVYDLAARYDLSPALIEALVWQESRWREDAISPKGARGLAQLMPTTAKYLGVDPDDPFQNLEGGARYLREQINRFDGNLEWALAAYNAGPGRVEQAQGIPRIKETRLYVASIMTRLAASPANEAATERMLAVYENSGNGK